MEKNSYSFESLRVFLGAIDFKHVITQTTFLYLALFILPVSQANAAWVKSNYFTASDLPGAVFFPDALATAGNLIVAGAPFIDNTGLVYIFNADTGHTLHRLFAADGEDGDYFGSAVAINEGTVVIGAPGDDDNGSDSGSAYVFDASTGTQLYKLKAADSAADDYFGSSVAVSGNLIVVGALFHETVSTPSGFTSGAVYVYEKSTGNLIHKLTGSDANGAFGLAVAVNQRWIVVSSLGDGGVIYVFNANNGNLSYTLSPYSDDAGLFDAWSLAVSNQHIVIGAGRPEYAGEETDPKGAVFVYEGATGSLLHKLTPGDDFTLADFGIAVAMNENTLVVGAGNALYLYDVDFGLELQKFLDIDEAPRFRGEPIDMSEDKIVVGNVYRRSIYVYEDDSALVESIDFENILPSTYPLLSVDGFDFSPTWNTHVFIYDDGQTTSIAPVWGDTLQFARSDGLSFNLSSFDYVGRWPGVESDAGITGTLSDGSTVSADLYYDASVWKTKTLNWEDLVHVAIHTPAGRLQIDNLIFNETTEPLTTLNFESQPVGNYASVIEAGYELMPLERDTVSFYFADDNQSITSYWNDSLRLAREDGGTFSLYRFDYTNRWRSPVVGTLDVIGLHQDGTRIYDSITFPLIFWNKRTLNWSDLLEVEFSSSDGRVMLDNIEVIAQ